MPYAFATSCIVCWTRKISPPFLSSTSPMRVTSSSALLLCSNTVSPFCLQEIFISMLQCNITFALSQFPSEKNLLVDCNRTGFAIQ